MERLLLIDGINFFFKGMYAHGMDLTHDGHSVKCLYAFQQNLCRIIRKFKDDCNELETIVCWDGGHDERTRISEAAVTAGIIPMAYKQERAIARAMNPDKNASEDFSWQLQMAKELVSYTKVKQTSVEGEEADDVIATICRKSLGQYDDIVIVTTDRDYYQLLWDGVRLYNSTRDEFLDKSFLKSEYNLDNADQWVDVGAIAGETGASSDTIYGVPGIGYVIAAKLVSQYGSLENIYKKAKDEYCDYISRNGMDVFMRNVRSGEFRPKLLKEAKVLAYRDVVDVAMRLKRMRSDLKVEINEPHPDWERLERFYESVGFRANPDNFYTLLKG